ncbi:MAG: alpha-2-macroglobulin family protein [Bacteroidota bacterium]
MKQQLQHYSGILGLMTIIFIFAGCSDDTDENFTPNPAFTKHIAAFSSGVVSAHDPIEIQLVNAPEKQVELNEPVEESLFEISPEIAGKTIWSDQNTITFVPEKPLKSGEKYWIKFNLGAVAQVEEELKTFKFPIKVVQQAVDFESDGLVAYDNENIEWQQFRGKIVTADRISEEELDKTFEIEYRDQSMSARWEQRSDRIYTMIVDSVERFDTEQELHIQWSGQAINAEGNGEESVKVPALGDFKITSHKVVQHPEQYVLLRFSDPLSEDQDIQGLVEIEGHGGVRTAVSTNELRIYPASRLAGDQTLIIHDGVENCKSYPLGAEKRISLLFQQIKPDVRLTSKGTILPSSNAMTIPFEAVNLKAVDVRIIKIYEDNIAQFFQNNDFDGSRGLKRVGRLVRKKTIALNENKPIDYGQWNHFNLDLSEYIEVDQGAIYRVQISFRKHHSTFPCNGELDEDVNMDESDWDEYESAESDEWNYINDYSYNYSNSRYFSGYNYRERENPCSYSYYRSNSVVTNIFASDIGIVAKSDALNDLLVAVTDIPDAEPMEQASVKVYDYQQQMITSAKTNDQGIARINTQEKQPFFLEVSDGTQKGYLRLSKGSARSMSRFDVGGTRVKKGIKGFLYGERGVWRPGDTLFLNFMLEDRQDQLPADHPVIYELYDARGQLYKREILTNGHHGLYDLTTPTEQEVPTGNWRAKVEVGGATFTKTIKVETIKPNRLKVQLDLDQEVLDARRGSIRGDLSVHWLHGAPARKLRSDVALTFVPAQTAFSSFKKFVFDDPVKQFEAEEKTIYEGPLDDSGQASFVSEISTHDQAPGMLKAVFKSRAFESGGDFSTSQQVMPYAPFSHFVGVKSPEPSKYGALQTDSTYQFEVVSVDKKGNTVPQKEVEVDVYRIDWSWWWERGRNNLASYIGRSNIQPVSSQVLTTNKGGKGKASINIPKHDWGRYLIRVKSKESGHSTGLITYFDWPSSMSRAGRKNPDGANMLVFASDKENYTTGESARISFPSSKDARALVSIEDGNRVLDAFWIETEAGETNFDLPITPDLAPNCYVHITLIQPHEQSKNDAPLRLYGVIPIMVKDPETILSPVIEMPDELAPESTYELKVSEQNDQPMTYTVAVVDEGLLDLTNFETPDPWNYFYSREALGVKTWDLYDHVIGAYGGKVENLLTIGGDTELEPGNENTMRFEPMVRHLGPFHIEAGQKANHRIHIPNYVGAVRTMVVAGHKGAYGKKEQSTPVKKPLMTLASLPRTLKPNDEVNLPVTIFAMDEKINDVQVRVKTNDMLKVQGSRQQSLRFDQTGDRVVNFSLKVAERIGKATVQVVANGNGEKSTYEIELDVKQPNLPQTEVVADVLDPGESWTSDINLNGIRGTNRAMLEVSSIPPIDLNKRLQYLIRYPHGCIEQVTSSAFPQLYLETFTDMSKTMQKSVKQNITAAIQKIRRHQLGSGGFAYWSGSTRSSDWGSSFAGHFLIEAEEQGYTLPYGVKEKWIQYQRNQARKWNERDARNFSNSHLAQAYRLYTLALAGEPVKSAMNRLRESSGLDVAGAWRLALAYEINGNTAVAQSLVKNRATRVKPYKEMSYTFGSHHRDQAMIIETLTQLGRKKEAATAVKSLAKVLSSSKWMSTQTTAFALKAIAEYIGDRPQTNGVNFNYSWNGDSDAQKSHKVLYQKDLTVDELNNSIQVENTSNTVLFARVVSTGIPASGDEKSAQKGLNMRIAYKNLDGELMDISRLEQGTDFLAEVTIEHPGTQESYKELALTQLFPAGWEIHNARMDISGQNQGSDPFTYRDIRDDRVHTYFNLSSNSSKTFVIKLHAAFIGEYYLPAVQCEAMYDASIFARQKGRPVRVVQPGK